MENAVNGRQYSSGDEIEGRVGCFSRTRRRRSLRQAPNRQLGNNFEEYPRQLHHANNSSSVDMHSQLSSTRIGGVGLIRISAGGVERDDNPESTSSRSA